MTIADNGNILLSSAGQLLTRGELDIGSPQKPSCRLLFNFDCLEQPLIKTGPGPGFFFE